MKPLTGGVSQGPRIFCFCRYFLFCLAVYFAAVQSARAQGGNFLPAVNYAVGGQGGIGIGDPSGIAVGDFNGDGKLDIVAANQDGTVSVLLGNGDGTFQQQTVVTAVPSSGPYSSYFCQDVAVGDFNGDGKADLAVLCLSALPSPDNPSNTIQGTLNILIGNGNGGFQSPTAIPLNGSEPLFVRAADLRNGGKIDLAVLNVASANVSILLGNGNGTFQSEVDYSTIAQPAGIAVGDVNGDGFPDLAIAGTDGRNGTVDIQLGNSSGTFSSSGHWVTSTSPCTVSCGPPTSVAIGDINGDGKADLVANDGTAGGVDALLGNGNGTFQEPAVHSGYAAGGGDVPLLNTLVLGDFNSDGKVDVAIGTGGAYPGFPDLLILYGNGDGSFQLPLEVSVGTAAQFSSAAGIAEADLNGDGFPDLALNTNTGYANGLGYNAATVVLNCGLKCSNIALTSSAATSSFEQPVTFTATVTAGNAKATGTPTGSVTFQDVTSSPGTTLGTAILSNGTATLQYSGLNINSQPPGHLIQAIYEGDSNFDSSTSAQIQQIVTAGMPTLSATSSVDPSSPGQSVTFTVTVQPTSPVAPTGSVTLSDNGTVTLSSTLSGGTATFTTSSLTTETHSITFNYGGDSNFQSATSSTLTQIVGANATPFVVGSSPTSASVSAGSSAQFTISLAAVPGFKSMVTFSCSGLPAMSACQFQQASLNPNGTTVTTGLTITTTASGMVAPSARWFSGSKYELEMLVIFGSLGLIFLFWSGGKKNQRRTPALATCAFLLTVMMELAIAGCGGGSSSPKNNGTPAGTSTVTVTAASGNATTNTTVTLTVQ